MLNCAIIFLAPFWSFASLDIDSSPTAFLSLPVLCSGIPAGTLFFQDEIRNARD